MSKFSDSRRVLFTRAGVLTAVIGAAALLGAGTASAHVTANIYGAQPTKGGYGAIVLRVPNEEANAGTTKIEVTINPDYGISTLQTKPIPGWNAQVDKTKLPAPIKNGKGQDVTEAVTKVSWTAQPGTKIGPGSSEFQEFEISAGPLPSTMDSISLPTAQTYDDGTVVNWSETAGAGGQEPEHPAPTVLLAAASGAKHGSMAGEHSGMSAGSSDTADATATTDTATTDTTARWLGGAGLVVGALGLGFGAGAVFRNRKADKLSTAGIEKETKETE